MKFFLPLFLILFWACSESPKEPTNERQRRAKKERTEPAGSNKIPSDVFNESDPETSNGEKAPVEQRKYSAVELRKYIEENQIEEIEEFLAVRTEVNFKDGRGYTLLHLAVLNKNLPITQLLLDDSRINVNAQTYDLQYTPLHIAAQVGDLEIFNSIISHPDTNLNQTTKSNHTALHLSIIHGNVEMTQHLISDPQVNIHIAAGEQGMTPIHVASIYGPVEIVQRLLNKGAHPLTKSKNNSTPLKLALDNDRQPIVDLLLLSISQLQNSPSQNTPQRDTPPESYSAFSQPDRTRTTPSPSISRSGARSLHNPPQSEVTQQPTPSIPSTRRRNSQSRRPSAQQPPLLDNPSQTSNPSTSSTARRHSKENPDTSNLRYPIQPDSSQDDEDSTESTSDTKNNESKKKKKRKHSQD